MEIIFLIESYLIFATDKKHLISNRTDNNFSYILNCESLKKVEDYVGKYTLQALNEPIEKRPVILPLEKVILKTLQSNKSMIQWPHYIRRFNWFRELFTRASG